MKVRLLFDTQGWNLYSGATISSVTFAHCENIVGVKEQYANFVTLTIGYISSSDFELTIYIVGTGSVSFTRATMGDFLETDAYDFSMDAEITGTNIAKVFTMVQNDLAFYNLDGHTTIAVYKQNSANNVMNKTLTPVSMFDGIFNHSIAIKNINIDIQGYNILNAYNYVYIPSLRRYYYIDSLEIISADYVRLHLKEDVLMSWEELIKLQTMLVTRYENSDEEFIIDERLPMESRYKVDYQALTDTTTGSLVNCTFDNAYNVTDPVFLCVTTAVNETSNSYGISAPTGSGLPDVYSRKPTSKHYYLLNYGEYGYFNVACIKNSATASFVQSVIWLPFKPLSTTGFTIVDNRRVFAGTDALTFNKDWNDAGSSQYTFVLAHEIDNGTLPYLVTKDFTFPNAEYFANYKPYMMFEMYIAFIGYINLDMSTLFGKRCIIYYTLDAENGNATCYLYNVTDKKCVWSQPCLLGIKLDFSTSNYYQNSLQRELLFQNVLWGGMQKVSGVASAMASGKGAGAIGGAIGIVGDFFKYPLQNALIQDSMNTTFGSSDTSLYTLLDSYLKITYRDILVMDYDDFYHLNGKPYNKVTNGVNLTGYVEIDEIHFDPKNRAIYQDEIQEIVSLLKDGVVF